MKFENLVVCLPQAQGIKLAGNPDVRRVVDDSRQVREGDLFVARGGSKTSGAAFVKDALAAGAVAVVSETPVDVPANVAFAHVPGANLALAVLAQKLKGDPSRGMQLLAVTGTNGKTTITYLVRAIMRAAGHKCGLIGTVQLDDGKTVSESEMTTPGPAELADVLARMRDHGVRYMVMEASSHALHQDRVGALNFAVGMFTNLTQDHLDYHGGMDNYASAKAKLFEGLQAGSTAVINADDSYAYRMVQRTRAKVIRYGMDPAFEWSARVEKGTSSGTLLEVTGPGVETFRLHSPLVGKHNVYNTLCAAAAAYAVGMPVHAIINGLEKTTGAPGRLEAVIPPGMRRDEMPFQVLVDYAHTHDALENVLSALRPLTKGKLTCVFGCGGDRDKTKRPKMAAAAEKLADNVVVTSDNPRTEDPREIIRMVLEGFSPAANSKMSVQPDRRMAIRQAILSAGPGDVVLIAGKGHENYQIIGKTKHHFDDVEEALSALKLVRERQHAAPGQSGRVA